jgi:transposase
MLKLFDNNEVVSMKPLASWDVSDAFWSRVEALIPVRQRDPEKEYQRKPGGGRKPKTARTVFEGIVYVLRTGCQWKALPKEIFGSSSAIHKRFLEWEKAGVFLKLWQSGLAEYDEMEGVAWTWQSIDGAMVKAPLSQKSVGRNPSDRGKKGSQRNRLTDGRGVPLSVVVCGTNRHDVKRLPDVLDAIVIPRPPVTDDAPQNLCADAGYASKKRRSHRWKNETTCPMYASEVRRLT